MLFRSNKLTMEIERKENQVKLREKILKHFNSKDIPILDINTSNYRNINKVIRSAFKDGNMNMLVLFGGKETGKRMAMKCLAKKSKLIDKFIYINMRMFKNEMGIWGRLKTIFDGKRDREEREPDYTSLDTEDTCRKEMPSIRQAMEKYFSEKNTILYMANLDIIVSSRPDFIYTFLEEMQLLKKRALVVFSTADLECFDKLEERVKSRLTHIPFYFGGEINIKKAVIEYVNKKKSIFEEKLGNLLEGLTNPEFIEMLTSYYQLNNQLGRVFDLISGTLCRLTNSDISLLEAGDMEKVNFMLQQHLYSTINVHGNLNYEQLFSNFPNLYKDIIIACTRIYQRERGEFSISTIVNECKVDKKIPYNLMSYMMALKDLHMMNLLFVSGGYEGSTIVLFKYNAEIGEAVSHLKSDN